MLAHIAPTKLGSLRLGLHPAARFSAYAHSAVTVWQANRPPALPPPELAIADVDEAALVVRGPAGVTMLALDGAAQAFVAAIIEGASVASAATAALAAAPDADFASSWATLLAHGAFAEPANHGD